ncbi:TPA: proteasome accessory factor PafA2 [Candidatus Poribacteria bacterium]|nr:proteasome accessory factor PafA2 [Candidatus Poribacteria bacterium]HEX30120.1 proteasome accessory factor PafA2 [Candidatus Poribacteria bacterium]
MPVPKVMGVETEYGISVKGAVDRDPVTASTLVVNSYRDRERNKVLWDYDQESPTSDARGFTTDETVQNPDEESNRVINDILINGGRYYVDHAHPEYCTPECLDARELVKYDKAGEIILNISRQISEDVLGKDTRIIIHKNNSDHKGHSYGCHENYLMDRSVDFQEIVDGLTPFLVTRQIFTGSGKVGYENGSDPAVYQISQRADFFESEVGLSTMVDRPIINTRDEPHADEKRFRRLHVIVGDANMSEFTTYLKVGTTALVLTLIEMGVIKDRFKLMNPVKAIKSVSRDLNCNGRISLLKGGDWTPIQIQREYLNLAVKYLSSTADPIAKDILEKWEFVLDKLEEDPMQLDRHIDWVIKKRLIEAYMRRFNLDWSDHRVLMLDLQYHDVDPEKGLYYRLAKNGQVERILNPGEAFSAVTDPPESTRAYFRGMCLKKYSQQIHSVSWNSMVFELNSSSSLNKIYMQDPCRGTKELVGEILDGCKTADELIKFFDELSK